MGNRGQANYAASKAGLIGLSKIVAKELAGKGVTCNVVAPGFIKTDMTDVLNDKIKEIALEMIPLKRFGEASEIAACVSFLASPRSGVCHRTGDLRGWGNGDVKIGHWSVVIGHLLGRRALDSISRMTNDNWTNDQRQALQWCLSPL